MVEEALVGTEGARRIVASIRSLRLARFRYAQEPPRAVAGAGGNGSGSESAGDGIGEAELETVHDEVARALSQRWRLPEGLSARVGTVEGPGERDLLLPRGQWARIDRRRSIRNSLARGAGAVLREEDLRFRNSDESERPTADCLVIAVRDASGSMGEEKKFLCRSFFHWLAAFIRGQYQSVGMSFICHHTEAQAVGEEEFFRRAESGGTKVSSAYRLALDVARTAAAQGTNVIALHFTDGNWS
ncbi:sporulation protein YhbH, partial [mine drainage metagenome]